jgi:hypothetical protein
MPAAALNPAENSDLREVLSGRDASSSTSTGNAAPQRQVATLRGTRRPHEGQSRVKAAASLSDMVDP